MKKKPAPILTGLLAILLLSLGACNYPEETPVPCTEAELLVPENLSPHEDVVDPTELVTLSWTYPETACDIDRVEVYVWTGEEPSPPGGTGNTPGNSITWPIPLEPNNTYFWRAYAEMETGPGPDVQGPDTLAWFYTGPICPPGTTYQPCIAITPDDDAVLDATDGITFIWDDLTPCLVDYLYELQVSEKENFSSYVRRVLIRRTMFTVEPSYFENCTRYYWRVKTDPAGAPEEPYSDVWSFYIQNENTLCPISPEPALPVPTPHQPFAKAKVNLNCREGPSPDYEIMDTFFEGDSAPIEGRNEESTWWKIQSPNLDILCWVWGDQIETSGDLELIGIEAYPELAEPEPTDAPKSEPESNTTDCTKYTDQKSCISNSACKWESGLTRSGYCTTK